MRWIFADWGFVSATLCGFLILSNTNAAAIGDLNGDDHVDALDVSILESSFFTDNAAADLDGDGIVSFSDLGILKNAMSKSPILRDAKNARGSDTVGLNGPAEVRIGDVFTISIVGDFTAIPTLGGGLDLSWDGSVVTLTDVSVTAPDTNPPFTRPGDIGVGTLTGLAFGRFDGYDGPIEIAVLTFEAITDGSTNFSVGPNTIPAGPLVDFQGDPIDPIAYSGLSLTVLRGPVIDISPESVDFGLTAFGTTQVIVSNVGETDLEIGEVESTDPLVAPFLLANDNCSQTTLAPTNSCSLVIEFAPDLNKQFDDAFNIPSNDPVQPSVTVAVTGTGQAVQAVYITGFENDNVVKINLGTGVTQEFATLNADDKPVGIAVDAGGRVYVSLRAGAGNIVRYLPDGSILGEFTAPIGTTGPGLMDFAADGSLVAGTGLNPGAAYRFEPTGELMEIVPRPDQQQRFFTSIFPYGNFILAADAGSGSRDIFRANTSVPGSPIELFIADAPIRPHGMTIGHNGNLFIAGMQSVYEYDLLSGALVGTFIEDFQDLGIVLQPDAGAFPFQTGEFVYVPEQGVYLLTTLTDSLYAINTDGNLVAAFSSPLLSRAFGIAAVPTSINTVFSADPAVVPPGTDVGNAYPNLTLSTAQGQVTGSNGTITSPLELTSDNVGPVFSNGATFEHSGGPFWSAGQCCASDTVLRADFDLPTTSVRVEFLPDDLDTGVLQIYSVTDALIAERSVFNSLPTLVELTSVNPPIAYALATFVDVGLLGPVTHTASVADFALINVEPATIQFDAVPIGASAQQQIIISNQGDNVLLIGQLGVQEPLSAPFTLGSDNCSNQRLLPSEVCDAAVQFNPVAGGTFQETIDIQTNDRSIPSFLVQIIGRVDRDADGVSDDADNCLQLFNPNQRDTDGDSIGNRCDPDFSNDCSVNFVDLFTMRANFFVAGDLVTDLNGDGATNFADLNIMRGFFFAPPGPSGLPNICQ